MSEEEWNLGNRKYGLYHGYDFLESMGHEWSIDIRIKDKMPPEGSNEYFEMDSYYKEEDIETLREKLIKDIYKLAGKYGIECNSDIIIDIIDRRFGKE